MAVLGGLGVAAIALVGAGASAVFTTSTSSTQTITAGTPSVVTWSAAATNGCTTEAIAEAYGCTSVTLPTVGPVGSTFDTTPGSAVYIVNNGNIPVTEAAIQLTDSTNGTPGNYLQDQMYVCITSDPGSNPGWGIPDDATIVANGLLTTGLDLSPSVTLTGPTLAPGGTDEYAVGFYAGENSAECGTTWSTGPHTAYAWSLSGLPDLAPNPWVTPASLTSGAEGGSVTVTLTLTDNS
jgi:hypothetical protein